MKRILLYVFSIVSIFLISLMVVLTDIDAPTLDQSIDTDIESKLSIGWADQSARGRFINICLTDALDRFDYYHYVISMTTRDSFSFEGSGILHPHLNNENQRCFKQNIYLYSTRHNNIRSLLQDHVYPKNVEEIKLTVYSSKDKERLYDSLSVDGF